MASLKDTFISSTAYNSLPHITNVATVPTDELADLDILRMLLAKHNVPSGVSVRLIHKHFDAMDGEVMAFKHVTARPFGEVKVMLPINVESPDATQLRGINYLVDEHGSLQAYEYTNSEVIDMSTYSAFIMEFCAQVVERGLQNKFGLKLKSDREMYNWKEFEFPCQRSTIIIPKGLPTPEGDLGVNVPTEWDAKDIDNRTGSPTKRLCIGHAGTCYHCYSHKGQKNELSDGEWYLGAQKIEPGTPIYSLVKAITEVW